MRNTVAKRIRRSNACRSKDGNWIPSLYRIAKRVYKTNSQNPKFKISRRQKRLQSSVIDFTGIINKERI